MEKKLRQSNIELLRLLAGCSVVFLHLNFNPNGDGLFYHTSGIIQELLLSLETICICAVNIYVLIFGYFNINSKGINIRKIILLLLQTGLFNFGFVLVSGLLNHDLSIGSALKALVPVNYFVTLYIVLMLLSPYINIIFNVIGNKSSKMVIMCFALFSVFATGIDILWNSTGNSQLSGLSPIGNAGTMGGYSIVQFVLLYMIGAFFRKEEIPKKIRTINWIYILLCSFLGLMLWKDISPATVWMYCNPLVIFETVALFSIFSNLRFHSKVINALAPASFTCFLVQEKAIKYIDYSIFNNLDPIIILPLVFMVIVIIYILSYALMLGWNLVTYKWLK